MVRWNKTRIAAFGLKREAGRHQGKAGMPRQQQQQRSLQVGDHATFDPVAMRMLQQVVEDAWRELVRRGDAVAEAGREQVIRELLAHRVMSRATLGETDPARLME